MQMLMVYPEKCTACKICELACSIQNFEEFNPTKSRVQVSVFLEEAYYQPVMCNQCAGAPCVKVCPTEALVRDPESGVVELIDQKCIGCKMCVLACPFGAMSFHGANGLPDKCDYCGDADPQCAEYCPTDAIEWVDTDSVQLGKSRDYTGRFVESYKEAVAQ